MPPNTSEDLLRNGDAPTAHSPPANRNNGEAAEQRTGQVAKAFGVPLVAIKRSTKLYWERGPAGFFVPPARREGSQLNERKLAEARDLLAQGHPLAVVSQRTGVLTDTLRKAIKAGRLPAVKKSRRGGQGVGVDARHPPGGAAGGRPHGGGADDLERTFLGGQSGGHGVWDDAALGPGAGRLRAADPRPVGVCPGGGRAARRGAAGLARPVDRRPVAAHPPPLSVAAGLLSARIAVFVSGLAGLGAVFLFCCHGNWN